MSLCKRKKKEAPKSIEKLIKDPEDKIK